MIDLHCHMVPHIDDGASSVDVALKMARIAVAEGITTTACTPHIYPAVFENDQAGILQGVARLRERLAEAAIPLDLTYGADIQIVPELIEGLRSGRMATLNGSRYFLFEPPHYSVPQYFEQQIFDCLACGYVPVITHPERLKWLNDAYYQWFVNAAQDGAWIQITADAITGRFGREARGWAERFLDDGLVHILASDGHDDVHRPPRLSEGRRAAERWVGAAEAERLVLQRPQAILDNLDPAKVPPPPGLVEGAGGADEDAKAGGRPAQRPDEALSLFQRFSRLFS